MAVSYFKFSKLLLILIVFSGCRGKFELYQTSDFVWHKDKIPHYPEGYACYSKCFFENFYKTQSFSSYAYQMVVKEDSLLTIYGHIKMRLSKTDQPYFDLLYLGLLYPQLFDSSLTLREATKGLREIEIDIGGIRKLKNVGESSHQIRYRFFATFNEVGHLFTFCYPYYYLELTNCAVINTDSNFIKGSKVSFFRLGGVEI